MSTPGYQVRTRTVSIPNVPDLLICSLADRSQYDDPDGVAEKLGISPALWPLFGLLWPSAHYLAQALAQRPINPHERILEVGCGLALPSLVAHRRGMPITASDFHPLAHDFLKRNLALNHLPASLPYRYGHWGQPPACANTLHLPDPLQPGQDRYHLIIGSDILYERDCAEALSRFVDQHSLPTAEMWLVDANRGYRGKFARSMTRYRFRLQANIRLHRQPCLSGAPAYKGHLMKFVRGTHGERPAPSV